MHLCFFIHIHLCFLIVLIGNFICESKGIFFVKDLGGSANGNACDYGSLAKSLAYPCQA
jgi:hypothetical protein